MREQISADFEWLIPSLFLTLGVGALAIAASPSYVFLVHALSTPIGCFIVAWVLGSLWLTYKVFVARPASPLAEVVAILSANRQTICYLAWVLFVASFGLMVFTWTKSMLNLHIPFRADLWLADIDHRLFLERDPWTILQWLNFPFAGHVYHRSWFFAIVATLFMAAAAPNSTKRSAILLSYFALWLFVGPLLHILMPAVGPIFFERMGYGDRFSGLAYGQETRETAQYLWTTYQAKGSLLGSGISAMPSLHVTMVTWIAIAVKIFAPRLFPWAIVYSLVIFGMSIALGWHYAVDGLVGGGAAVVTYFVALALIKFQSLDEPKISQGRSIL